MKNYLDNISTELNAIDIAHTTEKDRIHIQLPNNFGILEIKVLNENEDSIQLIGGDFHTHGDIEAKEFNLSKEKAIAKLVSYLMTGKYLLIEEKEPNKKPRKLVAQSLDNYLKYLPAGTEYKIENKI